MSPNFPCAHWKSLSNTSSHPRLQTKPCAGPSTRKLSESEPSLASPLPPRSEQTPAEIPVNLDSQDLALDLRSPVVVGVCGVDKEGYWKCDFVTWVLLLTHKMNSPLFPVLSTLEPTLLHGVQTKSKESLFWRRLSLLSHVCLSGIGSHYGMNKGLVCPLVIW